MLESHYPTLSFDTAAIAELGREFHIMIVRRIHTPAQKSNQQTYTVIKIKYYVLKIRGKIDLLSQQHSALSTPIYCHRLSRENKGGTCMNCAQRLIGIERSFIADEKRGVSTLQSRKYVS
jgi:hypothetical protein